MFEFFWKQPPKPSSIWPYLTHSNYLMATRFGLTSDPQLNLPQRICLQRMQAYLQDTLTICTYWSSSYQSFGFFALGSGTYCGSSSSHPSGLTASESSILEGSSSSLQLQTYVRKYSSLTSNQCSVQKTVTGMKGMIFKGTTELDTLIMTIKTPNYLFINIWIIFTLFQSTTKLRNCCR